MTFFLGLRICFEIWVGVRKFWNYIILVAFEIWGKKPRHLESNLYVPIIISYEQFVFQKWWSKYQLFFWLQNLMYVLYFWIYFFVGCACVRCESLSSVENTVRAHKVLDIAEPAYAFCKCMLHAKPWGNCVKLAPYELKTVTTTYQVAIFPFEFLRKLF